MHTNACILDYEGAKNIVGDKERYGQRSDENNAIFFLYIKTKENWIRKAL